MPGADGKRTVKAKIPAEIDPEQGQARAEKAGTEIAKSFSGAFGNGIAPHAGGDRRRPAGGRGSG